MVVIFTTDLAAAISRPRILEAHEHLGPRAIGADEPVVGAVLGQPLNKIASPVLYFRGLRPIDRTLCIKIKRLDGAYGLDMIVDVSGAVSNAAVRLPFREKSPNFSSIRGLPLIQVAVLARVSEKPGSCDGSSDLTPASWDGQVQSPVNLMILSRDATATLSATGIASRRCLGLPHIMSVDGQLTSFDTACTIERLPCAKASAINIRRESDEGSRLPLITAELRTGCSR